MRPCRAVATSSSRGAVPRLRRAASWTAPRPSGRGSSRWHATARPRLADPAGAAVREALRGRHEELTGPAGPFPVYALRPRGTRPTGRSSTCTAGATSRRSTRSTCATRAAGRGLDAEVVLPDYPLAPEHTWRDSPRRARRRLADALGDRTPRLVLAGDSAGGGLALALALTLRDRGGPQPSHLVLHSPWVDLTTSTPETASLDAIDPWLFLGKLHGVRRVVGRRADDLGRPEVSPGLGDLAGLPPALMFCGTRDLLVPGCRLLADRAAAAGWPLTYVEAPDLIHVYPLLPSSPRPAGPGGVRWSSCGDHPLRRRPVRPARRRSRCTPSGSCARTCSSSSRTAPTPTSTAATSSPETRHVLLEDDDASLGYARVLDDGDDLADRPGRCWPRRPAVRAGRRRHGDRPAGVPRAVTWCSTPRPRWPAGTRRSASRSPARSSSRTASRTCRCGGEP